MVWDIVKAVVVLWVLRWLARWVFIGGAYYWLLELTKHVNGF